METEKATKTNRFSSDQCCTLQKDAEKDKDERKKNGAKNPRAGKHELHAIMEFAKQAMRSAKQAKQKEGEELNNFGDLSISTTGMSDAWMAGSGKSKSD